MISSKSLDKKFTGILKQMESYKEDYKTILCKAGLYSKKVKNFESMHQGKFIENVVSELIGVKPVDNDGKESYMHYGNCDFIYDDLPISMKSTINMKRLFLKDGTIGRTIQCKIFDASRKTSLIEEPDILLKRMLTSVGYEIPIMFYTYEVGINQGCLFLTSLTEIARYVNEIEEDYTTPQILEKVEDLFLFNKSAHYLLTVRDAFMTAKAHGRIIDFNIDKKIASKYVTMKIISKRPVIEEII